MLKDNRVMHIRFLQVSETTTFYTKDFFSRSLKSLKSNMNIISHSHSIETAIPYNTKAFILYAKVSIRF